MSDARVRSALWGPYYPADWRDLLRRSCSGQPRPEPAYCSHAAWDRVRSLWDTPPSARQILSEAGAVRAVAEGPIIAGRPVPQWLGLGRIGDLVAVARWEDGRPSSDFGPGALLRGPGGYASAPHRRRP